MPAQPIRTAQAHTGNLSEYLDRYGYQPDLTAHLDALPDEPFSQETVNEIVLWKVNRYAPISQGIRDSLHSLRTLCPNEHRMSEKVLHDLLVCDGVGLPMASTFLRFQNANVFQIIDQHAYRAVFGKRFPVYPGTPLNTKVTVYFKYLDALHSLAASRVVAFRDLDRILYVFDKEQNGAL